MGIGVVVRLIDGAEEVGLCELLGKVVVVAEQLGSLTPGRLHSRDGGVQLHELTEGVGEGGFTGTGNTLQNDQAAGAQRGEQIPGDIDIVVQTQTGGGEVDETLAQLLEGNVVVVLRRMVIQLVKVVDGGETEEAAVIRVNGRTVDGVAGAADILAVLAFCALLALGDLVPVGIHAGEHILHGINAVLGHLHGEDLILLVAQLQNLALKLGVLRPELHILRHHFVEQIRHILRQICDLLRRRPLLQDLRLRRRRHIHFGVFVFFRRRGGAYTDSFDRVFRVCHRFVLGVLRLLFRKIYI